MTLSRAQLRKFYRAQRQALPATTRASASLSITRNLSGLSALTHAHVIAGFMATENEVSLALWFKSHWARDGTTLLPRVGPAGAMEFFAFSQHTKLQRNRYNIQEPPAQEPISPATIDAMLVPLLAFDNAGHRLGMGGGYYDRYLSRLEHNIPLIGVAFACQQSNTLLPNEPWDVPLHTVVTENGVLEFDQH